MTHDLPSPAPQPSASPFYFVGNALALDLVNTEVMDRGGVVDLLATPADLAAWLREAGLPAASAVASPDGVLAEARWLRERLRTMAGQAAAGAPVSDEVIEAINAVLATRPGQTALAREGARLVSGFRPLAAAAPSPLVAVAESAVELLTVRDPGRVRRCEHPQCILYFYDTSRNRSRRWCSMTGCGSRLKAAAYYRRTRGARPDAAAE